jgi:hypothetical protein
MQFAATGLRRSGGNGARIPREEAMGVDRLPRVVGFGDVGGLGDFAIARDAGATRHGDGGRGLGQCIDIPRLLPNAARYFVDRVARFGLKCHLGHESSEFNPKLGLKSDRKTRRI